LADIVQTASRVGFCPDELSRLEALDDPIEFKNTEYALRWMRSHQAWPELLTTSKNLYYFYYVRGLWSSEPNPYLLWTQAAVKLGDRLSEFESLVVRANIAAKQQNRTASETLLAKLQRLEAALTGQVPTELMGRYRQALALHSLHLQDFASARTLWELNLAENSGIAVPDYNASLRWYALCLARQGDPNAREWLERSRAHSQEFGFDRALARTNLEIHKYEMTGASSLSVSDLHSILGSLDSLEPAITNLKDPLYLAEYLDTRSTVLRQLGDQTEAEVLAAKARSVRDQIPSVSISGEVQ